MRLTLAAALAACVVVAGATAADFSGKAQALMPAPKETAFSKLLAFARAKTPNGALARGWRAGVAAAYRKGTAASPIEATATVYVYGNARSAKSAWQHVCRSCSRTAVAGLQMRYRSAKAKGVLTFESFSYCRNVYAAVVGQGAEAATRLGNDVGTILAAIYRRAVHFGMSACT